MCFFRLWQKNTKKKKEIETKHWTTESCVMNSTRLHEQMPFVVMFSFGRLKMDFPFLCSTVLTHSYPDKVEGIDRRKFFFGLEKTQNNIREGKKKKNCENPIDGNGMKNRGENMVNGCLGMRSCEYRCEFRRKLLIFNHPINKFYSLSVWTEQFGMISTANKFLVILVNFHYGNSWTSKNHMPFRIRLSKKC